MESYRRKTPEEMLHAIFQLHRGRLKIFIGAIGGAGKTYHMLREGHALREQGVDVVACAVSTKRRPETAAQLEGLERIPSIRWQRDGEERKDLDMAAILARNPEVVLVDGLAHRNRPEAEQKTRLDDIRQLLARGISVLTTVNVYEIEGVTELAQKLTGIETRETVPAEAIEGADEVRLIDVSPETILQRLDEGRLCNLKDADAKRMRRGQLGKLRELALRMMAEDVNGSLERHRESEGLVGPSGATERILVSAQYHWNGSIYIRRGQQIARRLNGELLVVAFANAAKPLSKEAAAFKRSIRKLADKVGARFEELPLPGRRRLAAALVGYAARQGATRIVLGHSKMSPWQERLRGSITSGVLRRVRGIDVFFVADRADQEGERILPARSRSEQTATPYKRLTEQEVERKIDRIRRGRFKVYVGAAPGVGKTYAMLREGNDMRAKGIDAVVGLLETHGRAETRAQLGSLPVIERAKIAYQGATLEEMDVPAILARNPEVALIDELAHTNVPGSRHRKRYEDVMEILEAGISVVTTVNVQHLESLNDAVEQITGVRVRETVPDSLLRLADEVELIDVAPKALQERMRAGKIYAMEKVEQALGHFFRTGNLIALRELALREIADDVDERLESWERNASLRGSWGRRESIFVAVTAGEGAERLLRRGFRIAHRLKAEWRAVYVHAGKNEPGGALRQRLEALSELAERLGGQFETLRAPSARRIPEALLARADACRSTQIILGQPVREGGPLGPFRRSVVRTILRKGRRMDVLVVADRRLEPSRF
ncbi:histidine kinase [Cohnella sp. REN36]|uniref:histidine kinase n=1 Tax=Cohnella sp. REN36 TaxID=2887347 RepID=UPI001D14E24D|nr:histidine kinase [Cohnella sp. REN36]MCC3374926.1 histidine kinase [Cohnella sp. REN36]